MIKLTFSGDLALNNLFLNSLDINNFSTDLDDLFNKSDLNVVNLEAPIIESPNPIKKIGPHLSTDYRICNFLKKLNFNLVTLANNHILDHGESGLKNTINQLKKNDINFLGAGVDLDSASQTYIFEKNNFKIGFLNYAENEFSNSYNNSPGANPLDVISNSKQIIDFKKQVNLLIIIIHGGIELYSYPTPRYKKLLRYFADLGGDIIISHHTHRYNGYEIYNETPIFYGLGNFFFPLNKENDFAWATGVTVEINISIDKKISFATHPFLQNHNSSSSINYLNGDLLSDFRKNEIKINNVISNDELLNQEFDSFFESIKKNYIHFLQPFTSKYLHKLLSLGLIPSFLKNEFKKRLYLNIIRCEAHRELLLKLLKKN